MRREDWQLDRVPDHVTITFRVRDGDRTLAQGRDLAALTRQVQPQLRATLAAAGAGLQRRGLRSWDVGTLPQTYQQEQAGHLVTAYPALVDEGDTVAVALLPTEAEQQRAMWAGIRRLLLLAVPSPSKSSQRSLDGPARLVLNQNPHGSVDALLSDCVHCAADALIAACGGPPRDEAGFAQLRDRAHAELADAVRAVVAHVHRILAVTHTVETRLAELTAPALAPAVADVRAQLATLLGPGFATSPRSCAPRTRCRTNGSSRRYTPRCRWRWGHPGGPRVVLSSTQNHSSRSSLGPARAPQPCGTERKEHICVADRRFGSPWWGWLSWR